MKESETNIGREQLERIVNTCWHCWASADFQFKESPDDDRDDAVSDDVETFIDVSLDLAFDRLSEFDRQAVLKHPTEVRFALIKKYEGKSW